jgi:hypothetical protein
LNPNKEAALFNSLLEKEIFSFEEKYPSSKRSWPSCVKKTAICDPELTHDSHPLKTAADP